MDLAGFQQRLSEQYARLRDLRATENYPVYAIEHGFSAEERASARALLNRQLDASMRADRAYWLVWIAAAAEIGYRYDGTEYWESFASEFPRWRLYGDRNLIRTWYKRFASEFRGLTPSGPWARQFPIIAWPITQAILPRYLQRHFADHLFQLRHTLARSGELTLEEIGDLLSDRYIGGSSRFEGFLQQKALTSRIVMALGVEHVADTIPPIDSAMLGRIVRDFDKLGPSGSRLREARRVLRDARFINTSRQGYSPTKFNRTAVRYITADRTERPRLIARPIDEQSWHVALSIPDLATPLRQAALSPHDLDRARVRFRVLGEGNSWIPGRALFSYTGRSSESLARYPSMEQCVLEFDRLPPQGEAALRPRLILPMQPLRLMKIRTDGSAFEIAGRHVRAEQSYLLISALPFAESIVQSLALSSLQSGMIDTYLWRLDVKSGLGPAQIAALESLGLGYVLGVQMEPLGLVPRWNSANGALELLDTEAALFSLTSDVAVQEFAISVDEKTTVRFKPDASGRTCISLGALPVGPHSVVASALGTAIGTNIESDELIIDVRPSTPWQQAVAGKAGVSLSLEPRQASLEQLFSEGAVLRVSAPAGRNFKLDCRFYDADGTLFHDELIGRYAAPVSEQKLTKLVVSKLTSGSQAERLERAVRIELMISLDEYGAESVTFEKDAEPLRWIRLNDTTIQLSDDTGGDTPPTVECYELNAADIARVVEYQKAVEGIELCDRGVLLVAKHNKRHFGAIATVMQSHLTSFSDLGFPANSSEASVNPTGVLNALKRWHNARKLMGPMAFMARRSAIQALEQKLELLLCGEDWIAATGSVRSGSLHIGELYSQVFYSRGYASGLRAYRWRYETEEAAAHSEFVRLCMLYKVNDDEGLCVLAMKIAFAPWSVSPRDLPSKNAFEMLNANRALIRGAYFARLAADVRVQDTASEAA